jgi:hypothetical protein
MIFYFTDKQNEVKENNFENKIKSELKSLGSISHKLIISIIPIFDKNIFLSEPIFIAQCVVKDQLDIYREVNCLYSQIFDYIRYSRNGSNLIDIKIKIEKI